MNASCCVPLQGRPQTKASFAVGRELSMQQRNNLLLLFSSVCASCQQRGLFPAINYRTNEGALKARGKRWVFFVCNKQPRLRSIEATVATGI